MTTKAPNPLSVTRGERQPALEDACLYHGRSLYLLDRFPAALDALRRALALRETGEAHRLLALSLEAVGHPGSRTRIPGRHPCGGQTSPEEDPGIDYGVFLYRQARPERRWKRCERPSNATRIPPEPTWNSAASCSRSTNWTTPRPTSNAP